MDDSREYNIKESLMDQLAMEDILQTAESFSTPDSLSASADYINIMLTSYGYPKPLVFCSTEASDNCKIVNCLYSLLNDRKKDDLEREELVQVIRRLENEKEDIQEQLKQSKKLVQAKEKTISDLHSKLEINEQSLKKEAIAQRRLKEEITKVRNNMDYTKTQYTHETKRHAQEMGKLQDRLTKLMNSNYKVNIATLQMKGSFPDNDTPRQENDHLLQMRTAYNALTEEIKSKEKQILMESEDLRTGLIKLYTGARRLLESVMHDFDSNHNTKAAPRDIYQETACFRLPMHCGGKEAIRKVEHLLDRLKEEWTLQINQKPNLYTEEEMDEKQEMIQTLQQTVEDLIQESQYMADEYDEKVKIYKRFERGGFFDTVMPKPLEPVLSDSEDSIIDLENGNDIKFTKLKNKAIREQKKLTKIGLELGKEREKLKSEEWAFQQVKLQYKMNEILEEESVTAPTSNYSKTSPEGQRNSPNSLRPLKRFKSWLGAPSNQ